MATAEVTAAVPARKDVPREQTWDLESVFPTDEAWEAAFREAEGRLPAVASYRGRLGESAATLLEALRARDEVGAAVERVGVYAFLRRSEDATNTTYGALADRSLGLFARFAAACAFVDSELLAIPAERIEAFFAEEPGLAQYRYAIDRVLRLREHVRSAEVERVLAQAADVTAMPSVIRDVLEDSDLVFGSITDEQGNTVKLAQGNLDKFLHSGNREVRRQAWEVSADGYLAMRKTFAATLAGGVKRDVFYAKARNFPSSLEAALAPHAIPTEVFYNLLDTVWKNLPVWHRYFAARRKLLGLDALHGYDLTAPLVANPPRIPFADGVTLIAETLAPLGEEYVSIVQQGIADRWVDRAPNVGKGNGAFSSGTQGMYPFISMVYNDDLESVSTLTHELGHSLHSYYSWQTQPATYADYSMFAAETASNMHQALMGASLLARNRARDWTIAVIQERMSNLQRYLFTMPILARFELDCHERIERGEALTADGMSATLFALYRQGYGDEVVLDEPRMGITWARFPHLFSNFYVFQYATGISAAHALAAKVRDEGPEAARTYVDFLRAGGSKDPIDALQAAGIDMRSPEPVQHAFDVLDGYVRQLEAFAGAG